MARDTTYYLVMYDDGEDSDFDWFDDWRAAVSLARDYVESVGTVTIETHDRMFDPWSGEPMADD